MNSVIYNAIFPFKSKNQDGSRLPEIAIAFAFNS